MEGEISLKFGIKECQESYRDHDSMNVTTTASTANSRSTQRPPFHPPPFRRRRRINKAFVFCFRAHLQCDGNRPCERCTKREMSHICRTEDQTLHELLKEHTEHDNQFIWFNRVIRDANGVSEPKGPTTTVHGPRFDSTVPWERHPFCLSDKMDAVWVTRKIPNVKS